MDPLVDIFNLDRVANNGDWEGNTNNIYSSSCANNLNLEPTQLTFTPDTIPVYLWFRDNTFNLDGNVSVQVFINYISQEIIERGYPLSNIEYSTKVTGELKVDIILNNNQSISFSTES